jgi:PAS domain S-box-containing protein
LESVADAELGDEEVRQLAAIVLASDDAIFCTTPAGVVSSWNRGAQRLYGYTDEEMIGRDISTIFPEDRRGELEPVLTRIRDGARGELETQHVCKGERHIDVSLTLSPIRNDGAVVAIAVVAHDISDHKLTLARLARSNEELEAFAYVASHDLREPLRAISSFADLLARRYQHLLDEEGQEFVGYIVDGCWRMKALIDDVLAYSRAGRSDRPFEEVSLDDALDLALSNLRIALEEAGARIVRAPLPAIDGDRVQIVQALQNLLDNAIKYRSDKPLQIRIESWRAGREVVVVVRDNGIGFDPKQSERIFGMFQRLHTRDRYPGTGMGLALCKKIVERHWGRIWVESRPEQGAAFFMSFPAPAHKGTH